MEPLPPAYISAIIPSDIEVVFWDDRMEEIPYDDETDLVAISIETYTAKRSYQIASEFRKRGVKVIMGGFHASLQPDEVAEYADAIVIGEAEDILPQLIEDFRKGRMLRVYRSKGVKSDQYLRPDRSIFEGKSYLKLGLLEASRGCKFKCDFCAITSYYKATHKSRPIDMMVQEIEQMKSKKKLFFFVDDNIVSNPQFAKDLYRAIKPLNIKWVSQASITMAYDDELMKLMSESGCQGVLIGFESLNPANLASMNKQFNAARGGFEAALKKLNEYRLRLYATFVFGYDHDTEESFKTTVDFCIKHKIYMTAFNHLTPFPGTPLYRKLEKEGRLLYDKWWLDDRYRYGQVPFKTKLPPEVIQEECVKARKRFYSLSSIGYRMFNRTNSSNFSMWWNFNFINLLLRKEASQRENYPLGDESFTGELLKVKEPIVNRKELAPV
jgi:radical SAM superfamily enzyme YgiQ (UPF0313 family)